MGWKIYFWVFLLILLIGYAVIFLGSPSIWDFLDVIISLIAISGLFSYAYQKKILSCNFWKAWLFVIFFWDIIYNLLLSQIFGLAQNISFDIEKLSIMEMIISWVLIIPEYIALYLLGFKSSDFWENT